MSHATKMIGEGCVMGRSTRQKLFSKKLAFKTVRKPYVNFLFRKMSFVFVKTTRGRKISQLHAIQIHISLGKLCYLDLLWMD